MADASDLDTGQRVYDKELSSYEVVEVLDETASEVVAKGEVKDRGHTIYSEKSVADLNPYYPSDDVVVRVRNVDSGRELLWPVSRVMADIEEEFE